MTSFHKPLNQHKCKIDCTNSSEILSHLQQKNSHLYLVWQNYNSLYLRSQQANLEIQNLRIQLNQLKQIPKIDAHEHEILKKKIFEYEKMIDNLKQEVARAKQEKKISIQNEVTSLTNGYQKQIKRLKDANSQLQNIIRLKDEQIKKLKSDQDRLKKTFKQQQNKYLDEIDGMNREIAQLKRQIRQQVLKNTVVNPKHNQEIQKRDQIIKKMKISFHEMQFKYEQNLKQQLQRTKRQFQNQLSKQLAHYRSQSHNILIRQTTETIRS